MKKTIMAMVMAIAAIGIGWAGQNTAFMSITDSAPSRVQDEATIQNGDSIREYKCDENQVYFTVEQQPEFPGGMQGMMEWLGKTMKYPTKAFLNNIQGRVMLKLIIEKNGKVSNVEVIESADPDLDKEAVRVAKKMPKWEPGKINGEPVRLYLVFPVNFRLQTK